MGNSPLVKALGTGTTMQVAMIRVSNALGQVPLNNAVIAGGSTLVSGGIGGILNQFLRKKA
jgi:hypothetical protein